MLHRGVVSLATVLIALLAGCFLWTGRPFSRLSGDFRAPDIRTVGMVIDAGSQSRVTADQVMKMLRLMLLYRGYKPVLLTARSAGRPSRRLPHVDAVLSVALSFRWQSATQKRGNPSYDYVVDIPRVSVTTNMRRSPDGETILTGKFAEGGLNAKTGRPPAVIEDEWTLVVRGIAATLRALPIREVPAFSSGASPPLRRIAADIATDEEYRRLRGWEARARTRIEGASRILAIEFGLVLVPTGLQRWVSPDRPRTLADEFASMRRQVSFDSTDIVIGLTGQKNVQPDSSHTTPYSVSDPFGRALLVRQPKPMANVPAFAELLEGVFIAREVVHLFGAPKSDTQPYDDPLGFDERTRQIVSITRNRAFRAGEPLNVDTDSLAAIYRRAGASGRRLLRIVEQGRVPGR